MSTGIDIKAVLRNAVKQRITIWESDDSIAEIDSLLNRIDKQSGIILKLMEQHDSDCALNNEPAYPAGDCNCRLSK